MRQVLIVRNSITTCSTPTVTTNLTKASGLKPCASILLPGGASPCQLQPLGANSQQLQWTVYNPTDDRRIACPFVLTTTTCPLPYFNGLECLPIFAPESKITLFQCIYEPEYSWKSLCDASVKITRLLPRSWRKVVRGNPVGSLLINWDGLPQYEYKISFINSDGRSKTFEEFVQEVVKIYEHWFRKVYKASATINDDHIHLRGITLRALRLVDSERNFWAVEAGYTRM